MRRGLGADAGAAVRFDAGDVGEVETQPTALQHILLNLVGNACRYVGREDGRVEVSAQRDGGRVEVCVADNGPGIPARDRERVFDFFARGAGVGRAPGSGVGLALTRQLSRALGGEVVLEDNDGGGCLFRVTFPG